MARKMKSVILDPVKIAEIEKHYAAKGQPFRWSPWLAMLVDEKLNRIRKAASK